MDSSRPLGHLDMLRHGDPVTASNETPHEPGYPADTFRDDLRAATSLLEQVIADRSRLVHVPFEERQRFLDAVGHVFHPDARARRAMVKATTQPLSLIPHFRCPRKKRVNCQGAAVHQQKTKHKQT